MNKLTLGSIANIRTGKLDVNASDKDGLYPFFTCAKKPYRINKFAFDGEAVLIAGNGDLNVKYYKGKFNAYQRTYVIEKKQEAEFCMKYLYYYMQTYISHLRKESIGGIIKYIKLGQLTEAVIPLPNIKDQVRISDLLSKIENLIKKRKQQLSEVNTLLNSVFTDMFGDPISNKMAWNVKPLSQVLAKIDSGWSPRCEKTQADDRQWGVLKLGAVTYGEYDQFENKAMLPGVTPKIQHEVKAGDLLFTRKNTYDLVAATAFVYETRNKLLLSDLIFRLVIKDTNEVHPIYLWKLLSYPSQRKKIQSLASGAAGSMPNISKANLKAALVPIPDINIQLKFVEIVNKIETIKTCLINTLEDLELLYNSSSQKAFRGELDLSAVSLTEYSGEITEQSDNDLPAINQIQKKLERITKPLKHFGQITKSFEQVERITKPLKHLDQITKSFEQIERITKPLKHLDQITKRFEAFSLPETLPDFSKEKTRKKWLIKLFKEFLTDIDQHSFLSLPDFLEVAQNWISEFEQEDGEVLCFLIDDYEALKNWIFNETRKGTILQIYHEASNSIKFKVSQ